MSKSMTTPSPSATKKYVPTKPPGFIEDQAERRRVVEELAGSMPELPPAEEFLKWRRKQT
jgi:hypothetical protein